MSKFLIESKAGVYFGAYDGETAEEAFAAMVTDGGGSDGAEGTAEDWIITPAIGARVESGEGDDHDTGRVESIDGDTAFVSWDGGVKTPAAVSALRPL